MKALKPIGIFLAALFFVMWVVAVLFTGQLAPYMWSGDAKTVFLVVFGTIGVAVAAAIAMEKSL